MRKICTALFLFSCLHLAAQQIPQNSPLDLKDNDNYSSFALFDSVVNNKYRLFFTGEDHRYLKTNSQLELKMFKYLYKTAGVRMFVMEFGHSLGYVANKYVQTGDSVFKQVLKNHTFDEYYELFVGLKAFYDSLPDNEKFSVVSVDIEREPVYPVKLLESLLHEEKPPHDSISIHIDALKALSEYLDEESKNKRKNNDDYTYSYWGYDDENGRDDTAYVKWRINTRLTMRLLIANFNAHKEKYTEYLGAGFDLFAKEIKYVEDFFLYDSYSKGSVDEGYGNAAQQYIFRENYMEANVLKLFAQNENLKAFGQFGRCHTQRAREKEECSYYYFNSLATRLNTKKGTPLYGKVFSCPVFYPYAPDFMDANVPINHGLKKIINNTKKNTVTAYLLGPADTSLGTMGQRFNALIINNNEKDENSARTISPRTSHYDYDYTWDEKFIPLAEAGFSGYDFSKLNNVLHTNFKSLPQFIGFSINYDENWGFNLNNCYHWFPAIEQKVSDSLSITLSGFRVKMRFGKDIIKSNKYDFNIMLGYGFERWKLESKESFDETSRKDIFGNNRTTTYYNPAFIMDAGFDFRAHIEWVTIGAFAGYQLDFSNKHWRINSGLVSSSPKQSFSSYTVGASLGFNLSLY